MSIKKLLFISNHAAFFVSHRLNIYHEAKKNNFKFQLIFGNAASKHMENEAIKQLKKYSINYQKLNYSNNSFSILKDINSIIYISKFIKFYKPDIIHSASPKANIYAGILSKFFSNIGLVMSFSGMGYLYTGNKKNLLFFMKKKLFEITLSFIFSKKKKKIIVQNSHDYFFLKKKFKLDKRKIAKVTGGSGVNLKKFLNIKKKKTKNIVMVSRVLKNKGALEFFKAAEILKSKFPDWKFIIVGSLDYNSPDQINPQVIKDFKKRKIVIFKDHTRSIPNVLSKAEIFCLPSHREGMPKATIEALAAGVPVVTSDAVGCKESIINNFNGLIFKTHSYKNLANKIEILILNSNLRKKF